MAPAPGFYQTWQKVPRPLLLCILGSASALGYWCDFTLATYLRVFFPLFGLYLLACGLVFRYASASSSLCLAIILGFAVLFRLLVLGSPLILSSDLYRYVWDGRVQRTGINPYRYPPQAEALQPLRDTVIYPQVHRPALTTIYPPMAQMLFAITTAMVPDSIVGMKAALVLCDLAGLGVLLWLLRTTGGDPAHGILYAWSPLVVFEFAGSGHVDALMLPLLLLALQARYAHRPGLSGIMLGLATLTKLYPAVVFPALYTRKDRRFPLGFGITIALGYLPYTLGVGTGVLGYLPGYLGHWEDFNGGLRTFLTMALQPWTDAARGLAMGICGAILLGVAYTVSRAPAAAWVQRAAWMIGAYLVLVPTTFHPWYVIWLLPCLCVTPSWGWLYLSGAISLSYLAYTREYPVVPLSIHLLEFVPHYLLLLAQPLYGRWRQRRQSRTEASPKITGGIHDGDGTPGTFSDRS